MLMYLNSFNDTSCNFYIVLLNYFLSFVNTSKILLVIVVFIILQRVFINWERGSWPVECWNINFMDWLRVSGGKRPKKSSVEAVFEAQDG